MAHPRLAIAIANIQDHEQARHRVGIVRKREDESVVFSFAARSRQ